MNEPEWRRSRVKRFQVAAIAGTGAPLIAALGRTLRWTVDGQQHLDAPGPAPILALWHGRILPGAWFLRHRGIVVLTSQNFDGEWIARIIERFGFRTARGSSSRNARAAMRQLIRDTRSGRPAAFTLDGPRGPALVAKPGAVWLAMATGHPIVPFHIEAARFWELRSWDRGQIPKPFSRIAIVFGAPITVTRDLDEAGLEQCRLDLEASLADLRGRALERVGRAR